MVAAAGRGLTADIAANLLVNVWVRGSDLLTGC